MKKLLIFFIAIVAISIQACGPHNDEDRYLILNSSNDDIYYQLFVKDKQVSNMLIKVNEKGYAGSGGDLLSDSVVFRKVNDPGKLIKYKPYAYDTAAYNQTKDRNFHNYDNWVRESKSNRNYIYTILEAHF